MAAPLKIFAGLAQQKSLFNLSTRSSLLLSFQASRNNHILHRNNSEDKIVVTDNGSTIVCWHPAPKFPYECSLPIPTVTNDVNKILKTQQDDYNEIFNFQSPQQQRQYLTKVTATTKHRWFPRLRVKFGKKTKPDREYL